MKFILILLCLLSPVFAINGGLQGGLASPGDLGIYVGGHLDPTNIGSFLLLHIPAEVMIVGNYTDFSAGAQLRYCFNGWIGWFAGGGLRVHVSQRDTHSSHEDHSGLGMDITGGYTFGADGMRISPELTIMAFEVESINIGCAFTF